MRTKRKEVKPSTSLKKDSLITPFNEIVHGEELKDKIKSAIQKMNQAVMVTMGPMGKTVIIIDEEGPYVTKDGVSVIKDIQFKDPIENMAAILFKQVAEKTLEQAGDGTTTATCLAASFVEAGYNLLEKGESYNDIKKQLSKIEERVLKILKEKSRKLRKSDIIDVATISANNDRKIGKLIQDAFFHSKIVKIEEGKTEEDKLTLVNGMELDTSYFDKAFINNMEKQAIIEGELRVIIVDGTIDKLDKFEDVLLRNQKYLIVADHFTEDCLSILKDNHNRNAFTVVPVKSPGFAQHRKDLLQDLAVYTNGKVIDQDQKFVNADSVGAVETAEVYKNSTILTVKPNEKTKERLKQLTIARDNAEELDSILLDRRVENLTGKVSIITVGGLSEIEMKERRDRIDDSVRAVGSALEEGIVEGGGVALIRAYNELCNDKDLDHNLVNCLMSPSYTIYINSNQTINKNFDSNRFDDKIIDPLKVTRCAFQNAISVASTILSTEAIVLNESLWR